MTERHADSADGLLLKHSNEQRNSIADALIALAVYAILALWLMSPVITECASRVAGSLGDNTSGVVWQAWAFTVQGLPPWQPWTELTSAPTGEPFWSVIYLGSSAFLLPNWTLAEVVGPVCAYNLSVLLGLVLCAFSMRLLVWHLTGQRALSLVAGAAYGFSAFSLLKAQHQPAWLNSWALVLELLFLLVLLKTPGVRPLVLAVAFAGIAIYSDPYMAVSAMLVCGSVVLVAAAGAIRQRSQRGRDRLTYSGISLGAIVAIAIPLAVVGRGGVDVVATYTRSLDELNTWSASWEDYLWPERDNPLAQAAAILSNRSLDISEPVRSGLFLGSFVVVGIALLIVSLIRRRRLPGLSSQTDLIVLGVIACVGFTMAMPPTMAVGALHVSLPSGWLFELVPLFRVISRFGQLAVMSLMAMASVGFAMAVRREGNGVKRQVWALVAAALVMVDLSGPMLARLPFFSYSPAPDVYAWLRNDTSDETIISDLGPFGDVDGAPLTWQPVHTRPMVNSHSLATERVSLQDALVAFVHPQTACMLNTLGADFAIRHNGGSSLDAPDYLRLVRTFSFTEQSVREGWTVQQVESQSPLRYWYDADVYETEDPSAMTPAFLSYGEGFLPGVLEERRGWAGTLGSTAMLDVTAMPGTSQSQVSINLDVRTEAERGIFALSQGSQRLWIGIIGPDWQRVTFTARVGEPVRIEREDVMTKGPDDPRLQLRVGRFGTGDCA